MTDETVLVLASNSPRRRQLILLGGWAYRLAFPVVNESVRPDEAPEEYVVRLAQDKARAAAADALAHQLVVAADTAVVDGPDILGKPSDRGEAVAMLRRLRGHTHRVFTGLAVLRRRDGHLLTDLCVTDVPMRDYTGGEIDAYVDTGDPLDKAGAYAIQHPQFQPVERLQGCYASVMGLPVCHLARALQRQGLHTDPELPSRCQSALHYDCPVHAAILGGGQSVEGTS